MVKVVYGDVLNSGEKIIAHQVNCVGIMGGGIAHQIKEKYPEVYKEYFDLCDENLYDDFLFGNMNFLGTVQPVKTNDGVTILNCFAQGKTVGSIPLTNYDAFRKCMKTINASYKGERISMPYKIGCGLAGGDWSTVSRIIEEEMVDCDVVLYRWG